MLASLIQTVNHTVRLIRPPVVVRVLHSSDQLKRQRNWTKVGLFQRRMQFLANNKRTISEKVVSSLASRDRLDIASGYCISDHSKWCILLPIWKKDDNDDADGQAINYKYKVLLQHAFKLRTKARKGKLPEPLCSSCLLNDVHVLLGERRSSRGLRNGSILTWIAAKTSSGYLDDLRDASSLGRARGGGRLGRGYRSNDESNRGRRKPSRSVKNRELDECHEYDTNDYDAILVLAGGQVAGGGVPVWVERRLDKALDLQQRSRNGALCKIVCLGGGTPHRAPILSSEGFVIHESTSCAEYLHSRGAPFAHLIKEWASYDTIGNGYFSLTQHAIPRRWRRLAVVTSEFHMARTRAVFEWIFGLQGAGIAIQQYGDELLELDGDVAATGSIAQGFHLEFHSVPDHGDIDETIAQARLERERNSIENLNMLSQRIPKMEDFHEWFHTEHKAYNTEDQLLFGKEDKDDPALQSY